MGLEFLEFVECLIDSFLFREKLYDYEKEFERMNKVIKFLVNDGKEFVIVVKCKIVWL